MSGSTGVAERHRNSRGEEGRAVVCVSGVELAVLLGPRNGVDSS
ncbi:MAG: hypothetical protein ACYSYT_08675 [Planctomycetota bacterium]